MIKDDDNKKTKTVPASSSALYDDPAEFSEVDLLRWIAQQSAGPDQKPGEYSDRIADAYGQKSGE